MTLVTPTTTMEMRTVFTIIIILLLLLKIMSPIEGALRHAGATTFKRNDVATSGSRDDVITNNADLTDVVAASNFGDFDDGSVTDSEGGGSGGGDSGSNDNGDGGGAALATVWNADNSEATGTATATAGEDETLTTSGAASKSFTSVTCDEYRTAVDQYLTLEFAPLPPSSEQHYVKLVVNSYIAPAICVFGIVGNLLNCIVLSRKYLGGSMSDMEKSVNNGLIALAASDLFLCVCYLVAAVVDGEQKYVYSPMDRLFWLYAKVYQEPIINIFLLVSTLLTTVLAVGRFLAICHPLTARFSIKPLFTQLSVLGSVLLAVALNLPRFLHYEVVRKPCSDLNQLLRLTLNESASDDVERTNCSCFYSLKGNGILYSNRTLVLVYNIIWTTLAAVVPFILISGANFCLIRALRHSQRMQKKCRANRKSTDKSSTNRITLTLVLLSTLFAVLVSPSECLAFVQDAVAQRYMQFSSDDVYVRFRTATMVANCLQLVNFAVANFILYNAINAHFRRTVGDIVCLMFHVCACRRRRAESSRKRLLKGSVQMSLPANTMTYHVSELETEL